MPNTLLSRTKTVHYVCAALLIILLVMQFTPFWHVDGTSVSISGYIWFPSDHADLTSYFQQTISEDFVINNILVPCLLMLVLGALGAVFAVIKVDTIVPSLLSIACGVSGFIGFLVKPALRLGSTWWCQMLLCAALIACGVYALVMTAQRSRAEAA